MQIYESLPNTLILQPSPQISIFGSTLLGLFPSSQDSRSSTRIKMSSTLSSMTISKYATSTEFHDENNPLWAYVTTEENRRDGGGGNKKWTCNFCQVCFKGSYSRVKAHLMKVSGQGIRTCFELVDGVDDFVRQSIVLRKRPRIVVATPGRLVDHLCNINVFSLRRLKFLRGYPFN